jgi:hypothetical protein
MSYMNAIAEEDYATACGRSLGRCARVAPAACEQKRGRLHGDPAQNAGADGRCGRPARRANGEITKVRVEDDRAFVIFAPPAPSSTS